MHATLNSKTWVLVCDGRKALLLRNEGDHAFPKLVTQEVFEHPTSRTADLGSAAPGRAFSSIDGRRSAVEETDRHLVEEQAFLQKLASSLQTRMETSKIEELVLVAPARALGLLRKYLSPALHKRVTAEIDKDLVKMPLHEIEHHICGSAAKI